MTSESLRSRWAQRCAADGEFRLACRYWDGLLRLDVGDLALALTIVDGRIVDDGPATHATSVRLSGSTEVWDRILAPVPPPFFHDVLPAQAIGALTLEAAPTETWWQYYPAIRRAIDILREEVNADGTV
jgi:hypothetical protein